MGIDKVGIGRILNTHLHPLTQVPTCIHTEKYFRNLLISNQNLSVFTITQLICNQTEVRLVSNQSEYGKYNLISV